GANIANGSVTGSNLAGTINISSGLGVGVPAGGTGEIRFGSGGGVGLSHFSGTNPECPGSAPIVLGRKWSFVSCTGTDACNQSSCTYGGGWTSGAQPGCYYNDRDPNGFCASTWCASPMWTEVICLGN